MSMLASHMLLHCRGACKVDDYNGDDRWLMQDIKNINDLSKAFAPSDLLDLLGCSLAPSICGHDVRL